VQRGVQITVTVLLLVLAGWAPAWAAEPTAAPAPLTAGVAVTDITPPPGYRMSGYFRERLNTATRSPLRAKALVLAQGRHKAALAICDLICLSPDVSARARKRASEETGIPVPNIVIAATHTHTGPLYFGALRNFLHERAVALHGHDPHETVDYSAVLADKLANVITQAHASTRPVRLEAGVARETRLSFNRRFHMKDGTVRFNPGQQNPDILQPAGPIDPDVGILLLRDASQGQALAALTVFALHLDTTGGTAYFPDYPYYLDKHLRKTLGGDLVSFFGIGACGDINHIDVRTKGRRSTQEIGTMLAETAAAKVPELQRIERPRLAMRSAIVSAPLQRYTPEEIARARQDMAKIGTRELPFLKQVKANKIMDLHFRGGTTLPIEVQVLRLSSEVAIVTMPGEVFVDLGLAIKKASPFKTTLVIELANDGPGYIPTRKAFAEGSYETVNSRIQPGSGEMMVEAAVRLLKELAD